MRALHDGRTLYLLFHDLTDEQFGLGSGAGIWFDDEGGTPPRVWDGTYADLSCPAEQNRGEGRMDWLLESNLRAAVQERFEARGSGGACNVYVGQNGSVAAMGFELGNGSRTEVALPLDGPSALEVTTGDEFAFFVEMFYAEGGPPVVVGNWPELPGLDTMANAALSAFACNLPNADYDPSFPLDWEVTGSGSVWESSGVGVGECGIANQTGATGDSACVTFDGSVPSAALNLISPWFSLADASSASLSYRGAYAESVTSPGRLALEITADGTTWSPVLDWTGNHGGSGGEAVTLDLLAHITPGQPRVRLRWRFVGANNLPGGAQIDDVRLVCGPFLFSDGFETGLTTHWSAESP